MIMEIIKIALWIIFIGCGLYLFVPGMVMRYRMQRELEKAFKEELDERMRRFDDEV